MAAIRRYVRPFVFGLLLGLFFSSMEALRVSTNSEIHRAFYGLDFNRQCFADAFHLRERGEQLGFLRYMVSEGCDFSFRFGLFTAFFAFVLNQATGKVATLKDWFLNFVFGSRHYSILGLLTGTLAQILFGTLVSMWLLMGLLALFACIGNTIQGWDLAF